jgi:phage gp37-like protein
MKGEFDYHIVGIEDAILALLKEELAPIKVKNIVSYSGELDNSDSLKTALSALTPKLPCVMVSYVNGVDVEDPKVSALNQPIHFRHDCDFIVVCLSGNARGEKDRRVGVYKMLSEVRKALGGVRFYKEENGTKTWLNTMPFKPADIEHIGRLPDITAYAAPFQTSFRFSTEDRTVETRQVSSLSVEVEKNESAILPANLPGVSKR